MKLDVILRTHDQGSAHSATPRFLDAPKVDIVRTCAASLAASLKATGVEHRLTILDDHSSRETVEILQGYGEVIPLETGGFLPGLRETLKRARASTADLVYFVEDDYLHVEEAISEMVGFHAAMKTCLNGGAVALFPHDDRNEYDPRWIAKTQVMVGVGHHWRMVKHSNCTLLCEPVLLNHPLVKEVWDQFATLYGTKSGYRLNIHEGTTINRAWGTIAALFAPLPGLAAHLNEHRPPLFDFDGLWDRFASARKPRVLEAVG